MSLNIFPDTWTWAYDLFFFFYIIIFYYHFLLFNFYFIMSTTTSSNTTSEEPQYIFRLSEEKDLEAIDSIIQDGVEAIRVQGFDQWQDGYPNLNIIRQDQELNRSYVLEKDNEVVGIATLYLLGEPAYDKIYEGEWLCDEKYGCLHRVAVSKKVYGTGASVKLIELCEEQIKKENISYVRIDTHEKNIPMLTLLTKKCNYKIAGKVYFNDKDFGSFMRIALDKKL